MSIRGIDTNLIVPRTADMVREASPQQQQAALTQQFSAIMVERSVEEKAQQTTEVLEGKTTDEVDEDGDGTQQQEGQGRRRKRKKDERRGDPNYAGLSTSTFDVKV